MTEVSLPARVDETRPSRATQLLTLAAQLALHGDRLKAYQLSLETTRLRPADVNAWMLRAETAPSFEEQVACLGRIHALEPQHGAAGRRSYGLVRELVSNDPFLAYLSETDQIYHVHNHDHLYLAVPKCRQPPEANPIGQRGPLSRAGRWLRLAAIGLILGGAAALLLAPLAMASALRAWRRSPAPKERARCLVILFLAFDLWLLSFPITYLSVIHLFPR